MLSALPHSASEYLCNSAIYYHKISSEKVKAFIRLRRTPPCRTCVKQSGAGKKVFGETTESPRLGHRERARAAAIRLFFRTPGIIAFFMGGFFVGGGRLRNALGLQKEIL
jgi:hypothetical protein